MLPVILYISTNILTKNKQPKLYTRTLIMLVTLE